MNTSLDIRLGIHHGIVLDQPVLKSIDQAGYDYINKLILSAEDLIHKPGCRPMAVWSPDEYITCANAEEAIKSMTTIIDKENLKGRPATIEELTTYEAMFRRSSDNMILVALGEVIIIGGREYSAYRNRTTSERELRLGKRADGWPKGFSFLVVFEEGP